MYSVILFDLDGTLTDSSEGIFNSILYALDKFEITDIDRHDLRTFIGPPIQESFSHVFHFSEEETLAAVGHFRAYLGEKGIYENQLYPDVVEVLQRLKEADKKIVLATSKPQIFAHQILTHFHIADYFDVVAGATMDNRRSKKADVIAHALAQLPATQASECLMVGDREHDIIGANAHHLDSAGVLYGFGNRQELEAAGATYVIEKLTDLLKIV